MPVFEKRFLADIKRKALRRGVWFSALDRVERGILTLTGRLVDRVRSTALCVELVKILAKIRDASKSGFVRRMEEYGIGKAEELVRIAMDWGNWAARDWIMDARFVKYLTVIDMNQIPGFGALH